MTPRMAFGKLFSKLRETVEARTGKAKVGITYPGGSSWPLVITRRTITLYSPDSQVADRMSSYRQIIHREGCPYCVVYHDNQLWLVGRKSDECRLTPVKLGGGYQLVNDCSMDIDGNGNLVLHTTTGPIVLSVCKHTLATTVV